LKISIAMTTYNGGRYIQSQLISIANQTIRPDEVIIFDDCSTDNTVKIVQDFIEKNKFNNWTFYINPKNIGYIENFYQAIMCTSGDIIFLCDQDDVWHLNKIEVMIGIFKNNSHIKILNTSFRKIDSTSMPIMSHRRINRSNNNIICDRIKSNSLKKFEFSYILFKNISPGCTVAFNKECKMFFLKYYTKLCPHDWELNIYGALLNGLYFFNMELTDYRIHENNTIGIEDRSLASRLNLAIDYDKRAIRAKNEYLRSLAYSENDKWIKLLNPIQRNTLRKYSRIIELRHSMFTEKKLKYYLIGVFHLFDYIKLVGLQGIFDDLIYIVKIKSSN